jgi:hypothetical protein
VTAASKVFPPGTQPDPSQGGDRWGQIAVYLQINAKTTWKRGALDIITQVGNSHSCTRTHTYFTYEALQHADRHSPPLRLFILQGVKRVLACAF